MVKKTRAQKKRLQRRRKTQRRQRRQQGSGNPFSWLGNAAGTLGRGVRRCAGILGCGSRGARLPDESVPDEYTGVNNGKYTGESPRGRLTEHERLEAIATNAILDELDKLSAFKKEIPKLQLQHDSYMSNDGKISRRTMNERMKLMSAINRLENLTIPNKKTDIIKALYYYLIPIKHGTIPINNDFLTKLKGHIDIGAFPNSFYVKESTYLDEYNSDREHIFKSAIDIIDSLRLTKTHVPSIHNYSLTSHVSLPPLDPSLLIPNAYPRTSRGPGTGY